MWGILAVSFVFALIITPMVLTFTKKREGESDICYKDRVYHIVGCIFAGLFVVVPVLAILVLFLIR